MIRQTTHWFHDETKGPLPTWRLFVPEQEIPDGAVETPPDTGDRKPSTLEQYLDVGAQWFKYSRPYTAE